MKKLIVVSAILCASSAVYAADWTGFYIGANVGEASNNNKTDYSYTYLPGNGTGNFSDAFGNAVDNAAASAANGPFNIDGLNAVQSAMIQGVIPASLGSSHKNVFTAGALIGYNWQNQALVYGILADLEWLGNSSSISSTGTTIVPGGFTNTSTTKSSINWLSTERVSVGYAFESFMPYASIGFAFGDTKSYSSSVGTDGSITDTFAGTNSARRTGYSVGGGVDYRFCHGLIARAEVLYYRLGTSSYKVAPQDANSVAEGITTNASHRFDGTLFRIGLNYLF